MKNKTVLIILIVILSLIVVGLFWVIIYNKIIQEKNIIYKLTYYDNGVPGSKSEINIYNDTVEIIKTNFCSAVDCDESEPKKEEYNYSKENMDKLKKFIDSNFLTTNTNNIEINESELDKYQKKVIQGLLLGEYFFETNVEEYKYKLEYEKSDSLTYDIYFKDDKSILVKKLKMKDYDIVKIDTYSINFSEKNLDILNNYIEKEVKDINSNFIHKSSLIKYEINIINSIIENKESYLKDIQNEPKLMYTITYDGIDCMTPSLYLYSDNTYEYYYTFSTNNKKIIPKTGIYNYDITKIINSVDKYEENPIGPYYIKDSNDNSYITYNTNIELQEFLKSLNITLEKCLEQQ